MKKSPRLVRQVTAGLLAGLAFGMVPAMSAAAEQSSPAQKARSAADMRAGASGLGMAPPRPAAAPAGATMTRLEGVWVEGPGFDITYGGTWDGCTQRCLANTRCVMIEYYRPEKKCNLYDRMRPRKAGGSSFVGIRN